MAASKSRSPRNQEAKKPGSIFDAFQNPFAVLSKHNTRNITSNLGHVDGRSLRKDDSSELKRSSYEDRSWTPDILSSQVPPKDDLKRTTSFLNNNPRIQQSIDAFVVENQSSSVKLAARSLRCAPF